MLWMLFLMGIAFACLATAIFMAFMLTYSILWDRRQRKRRKALDEPYWDEDLGEWL